MNKKTTIVFILMISLIVFLVSVPNLLSLYQNTNLENKVVVESIDADKDSRVNKEKLESVYERMNIIAKSYLEDDIVLLEKTTSDDINYMSDENKKFVKDILKELKNSGLLKDTDVEGDPDILTMRSLTYTDKETFQSVMAYMIDFNINDTFISMLVDRELGIVYTLDYVGSKTHSIVSVDELATAWGHYWNFPVEGIEFVENNTVYINYDSKIVGVLRFQDEGHFSMSLQTMSVLDEK